MLKRAAHAKELSLPPPGGSLRKRACSADCGPPIAATISWQMRIGGGNGLGSSPKMKPKSMWKSAPATKLQGYTVTKVESHARHATKPELHAAFISMCM